MWTVTSTSEVKNHQKALTSSELIRHIKDDRLCGAAEIVNSRRKWDNRLLTQHFHLCAQIKWHCVNTPLKDWNSGASSVTPKAWQSLSGFPQDQVQEGVHQLQVDCSDAQITWSLNISSGDTALLLKKQESRRSWLGGWTGWNRTHVVLLRLPGINSNIKML